MPTKQTVTLGKIVDIRGTVYGPGTITVPQDIANTLIQYHEAQPGEVLSESTADLANVPASQLSADQLKALLAEKEPAQPEPQRKPAAKAEAKPAPPAPPAPPTPPAPAAEPPAPTDPTPALSVQEGGQGEGPTKVDQLMAMEEDELRAKLAERGVDIPEDVTEKAQLAVLLADADKQGEGAAVDQGQGAQGGELPAELPKGVLPGGFPGRSKLMAAGITTMAKLKEAGKDNLPGTLDQQERDLVVAELATMGD